jgi:pSer/pThr/pTyr-binding forkhead associated (FHA) protein
MNYVLQIVRGRSETNTLKLMDGVNSIGRHDDCLIRIRSAQVSRRHCEVFEDKGKLMVKDLGSSNGTYVNGKRVLGQQPLKAGDVLSIGGVTLRVDVAAAGSPPPIASKSAPKSGDTAEVDAIPIGEDELEMEEEFEVEIDAEPEHMDIIPLDDEPSPPKPTKSAKPAAKGSSPSTAKAEGKTADEATEVTESTSKSPEEEDAVAQFLMDLKLDDED